MLEKVYVYKCRRFISGSWVSLSNDMCKKTFEIYCDENSNHYPNHHEGSIYIDFNYTGKYSKCYRLEKLDRIEYYENGQYYHHTEKM